jgi:ABC-type amino acid transport substrate-binding protein
VLAQVPCANPPAPTHLKIVTAASSPYVVVKNGVLTGFIPELYALVAPLANVTYEMTLQADGVYGQGPDAAGKWDGMVGAVIAGTYDGIAADLTITAARDKVIDFTTSYQPSFLKVLYNVATGLDKSKYLVQKGSVAESVLMNSKLPKVRAIWKSVQANNGFVQHISEGEQKVLAGGFAFVVEAPSANIFVAANKGKVAIGKDILATQSYSLAVTNGSDLRDQLSFGVETCIENGSLQALLEKYNLVA